jgi:hypothetical protein
MVSLLPCVSNKARRVCHQVTFQESLRESDTRATAGEMFGDVKAASSAFLASGVRRTSIPSMVAHPGGMPTRERGGSTGHMPIGSRTIDRRCPTRINQRRDEHSARCPRKRTISSNYKTPPSSHPHVAVVTLDPIQWRDLQRLIFERDELRLLGVDQSEPDI